MNNINGRFLANNQVSIGLGLRRRKQGKTLDVYYPNLVLKDKDDIEQLFEISVSDQEPFSVFSMAAIQLESFDEAQLACLKLKPEIMTFLARKNPSNMQYADCDVVLALTCNLQEPIKTVEEAFMKLHLISQRLVKPHQLNLDNLFTESYSF